MQIYRGLPDPTPFRRAAATVGSYDGVHRGHCALLSEVIAQAHKNGGESVLFTFDPHPRLLLEKEPNLRLLTTLEEKCHLIEKAGIDHLVVLNFDRDFSLTSPRDFVRLLVERAGIETLIVGYDHRFGRDKAGSYELLQQLHSEYGLHVVQVAEQEAGHEHLSSTAIRRLIERGETEHAARLLGHRYLLAAEYIESGYLKLSDSHKLLPPAGNYAVRINAPAKWAGQMATLKITADALQLKTRDELPCGHILLSF